MDWYNGDEMRKKQIESFKNLLNEKLEYLLKNAGSVVTELSSENTPMSEYLDKASSDTDQSLKIRIRSREGYLRNKIRLALERIENGTFGICESCGEEISIKRLEARPVTTKCIECKELEERLEKVLGDQ